MKYFTQIAANVDTVPLLAAIARQPELWNAHNLRTRFKASPHSEADDIWLWFNDMREDDQAVVDDLNVHPYEAWGALPQARPLVFELMMRVGGVRLGRVIITRLRPGRAIAPHADGGAPAEYFERFQIALLSMPGANFRIGDEQLNFRTGDVWWIDNKVEHEVRNDSADDRIAMIVDIRCG